jgi:hypothetical protein
MANIEFTKDFADKKKGNKWNDCPNILASRLVNSDKVAKYVTKEETKKSK